MAQLNITLKELLEQCRSAFNTIPNKHINHAGQNVQTYDLASEIERHLRILEERRHNHS